MLPKIKNLGVTSCVSNGLYISIPILLALVREGGITLQKTFQLMVVGWEGAWGARTCGQVVL